MEKRSFSKGSMIFNEGSSGSEMYIILNGKVKVYKTINNEKIKLAAMEKGDFFGEMCFFLSPVRTASIEALEDTEVMVLTKENLLREIELDPDFAIKMISTFAKRIKEGHEVISGILGEKKSLEIMYASK